MATATWHGRVLATSDNTIIVEGNHYFPPDSVRSAYFRPSDTTTICPWKGTAGYYTVVVDGATNTDAAWFYPDPKPEAAQIKDHVAFWRGVEVTDN
ncbi:DUF427 domain-containing protein [Nocardia sp. R6R-6]|uniref:DUF427 domain-containing protein n=1 Tax=Nocardia sp. R6R-6 TaxID=3459303 RepID=UPI00403E1B9C